MFQLFRQSGCLTRQSQSFWALRTLNPVNLMSRTVLVLYFSLDSQSLGKLEFSSSKRFIISLSPHISAKLRRSALAMGFLIHTRYFFKRYTHLIDEFCRNLSHKFEIYLRNVSVLSHSLRAEFEGEEFRGMNRMLMDWNEFWPLAALPGFNHGVC